MAQTVALKGNYIRKEVVATGTVRPRAGVSVLGAQAAANTTRKAWALENDIVGRGIETSYASGEVVQCGVFEPGSEVSGLLANGQNVAAGAILAFGANGELVAAGANPVVAFALEAINNSSGGALPIRVEVA